MKYQNAFDRNNAPFDPDIVAKVDRVFEQAISDLRVKFGTFDKRGEERTLQRCKEHAAIALVGCSLEWQDDEGLISMLPRAEMKLAEALEAAALHWEPKAWPKGIGSKHNLRYNPCNWFSAKCVAVFWQLEVDALKGEGGSQAQELDFGWIKQTIAEAAQRYPHVTPAQVEQESRELIEIAQAYFDDLASGIYTPEEVAANISKYKEKAKAQLLEYPTKINTWEDGRADRSGKFTLECHALVLAKLEGFIIYPRCTAEEMKQDISELCPQCPLPAKIREGIKEKVIAPAKSMQSSLPPSNFEQYLKSEIEGAAKAMQKLLQEAQRPGAILPRILEDFIWNKERLKALQSFFQLETKKGRQPETGGNTPKEEKPTTKVWALYYWYLQEAGLFDGLHNAKMKTVKELAQKHGLGRQSFYQTINAIKSPAHEKNPKRNPENIEKVIPLLEEYPQAQQLAIDDLAKMKKDFTG